MANQYTYRPNMNRNVTRKWAEARQVNYGGDDWGDDGHGPPDEENVRQPLSYGQRSFTNPTLDTQRRMSFDRESENRNFSAGPGPMYPNYGAAQPGQYDAPAGPRYYGQPEQSPYEQPQYHQPRIPESQGRTSIDSFRRGDARPDSRGSANAQVHPPRKSSIGQNDFKDYSQPETLQSSVSAAEESEPLPFIRPADIWKKHEEEQREKERRSQESARPSVDSNTSQIVDEPEPNRRRQPTLDTVAERRSEYLDNLVSPTRSEQHVSNNSPIGPTDTPVSQAPSLPTASQPSQSYEQSRPALPQISRTSTFGTDFLNSASPTSQQRGSQQPPLPISTGQSDLEHRPSQGYRSMVQTAFQAESRRNDESPTTTADSLLRTNTTSTSDISPIVGTPQNHLVDRSLPQNSAFVQEVPRDEIYHSSDEEDYQPPKRVNTNRKESPSPARRPQSLVAPDVPEPLSAIASPVEQTMEPTTARAAQIVRPGLANLVHQRGPSKDFISNDVPKDTQPQAQGSGDSYPSNYSNQRTTSEEWASWNAARSEAHARHGIQDSNPATPGLSSSNTSTPAPPLESLDRNTHMPSGAADNDSRLPSQRPQIGRDESFRPILPGGWMSSNSIQKTELPEPLSTQSRPPLGSSNLRTDSTDSIPTATAPRDTNWRSQYSTGSQDGPLAAATAAGAKLAGIFNGPSLTLDRDESEVSSINEPEEGPTGLNTDVSMKSRDFAASPEPPQTSTQSASRDFAASSPHASEATPRAKQIPFQTLSDDKPILALPGQAAYSLPHDPAHDSPTKESEWWNSSDDEAEPRAPASAPAPLRTNRLSTVEPSHANVSPISRLTNADNDQLESDIVTSLTPKSSSIQAQNQQVGNVSPTRDRDVNKSVSPPFAAAALAMSPGREYQALQEQNTFRPLTAPSSKAISPTSQKIAPPPTASASIAPITNPGASPAHPVSAIPPPPISLPTMTGQERASEAPSLPAFDAAKRGPSDMNNSRSGIQTNSNNLTRDASSSPPRPKVDTGSSTQRFSSGSRAPLRSSEEESPVAHQHGASSVNAAVTMPSSTAKPIDDHLFKNKPATPAKDLPRPVDTTIKPVIRQPSLARSEVSAISAPSTPIVPKISSPNPEYDPLRAFPSDKFTLEQINNMQSPRHRINAYDENRIAYAQHVGHLENWLSHMNTPEHADVFSQGPADYSAYTTSDNKRDSSGPPSASKMQEDGKRLFASASKMGQKAGLKAGVLGKGLFSKGKEKLRTVSASQKGSISSRSTDRIVPDTERSVTPVNNAPQIPAPAAATPLDESELSAYFSGKDGSNNRSTTRKTNNPPFSPISEVSSNQLDTQNTLDRTISAVSERQSPQSEHTARPSTSTTRLRPATTDNNVVRPDATVSQSHVGGPRVSTDLLRADAPAHHRRDSSVSDISSVSDRLARTQSQATRTISPQVEAHSARDISAPPTRNISTTAQPGEIKQSQHAPSYSTATAGTTMMSKEAEALQDRVDEQTLPKYEQAQPKPPRISEGAQIIPVTRLQQDHDQVGTNSSRPFSFIGNESLSKTGYPTNQSIDNPGVPTEISATRDSQGFQGSHQYQSTPLSSDNPLPSARRNPEEYASHAGRTPEEFARLRQTAPAIHTKPETPSGFVIPGPYGQELRSPKPKSSSPMLEQPRTTPTTLSQSESYGTGAPTANALASAPRHDDGQAQVQSLPSQIYDERNRPPENYQRQYSQHADPMQPQYRPDTGPDADLKHQRSLTTSLAEHERVQEEERRGERNRASMFSSMFRTRSRSRSRRLRKEQHPQQSFQPQQYADQRPGTSKRNSLMQTQSRTSIPQNSAYGSPAQTPGQPPSWYNDEFAKPNTQSNARPDAGTRRLSKDLFKNAQYNQQGLSQTQFGHPQQSQQQLHPLPVASGKKKRFSGLFGKSSKNEQAPPRAQTMPMPMHYQEQQPRPQEYGQGPPQSQQPPPTKGYYGQATMPQEYGHSPPGTYGQQHPSLRQGPTQGFQGTSPPPEGYYGNRPEEIRRQSSQQQYSQQSQNERYMSPFTNVRDHASSPYRDTYTGQHESLSQQNRPDLPHLNTGERAAESIQPTSYGSPSSTVPTYTSQPPHSQQAYSAPARANTSEQGAYRPPSTRTNKDISHGSDYVPRPDTQSSYIPGQIPSPPPTQVAGATKITPRVAALHTRSRSPKLGRRDSGDLNEEFSSIQNSHSPVAGLGTFNNKKVSPMGGVPRHEEEQEKPWSIGLPGSGGPRDSVQEDPNSAASSRARELRRIMLERSPIEQQQSDHQQIPTNQTVADRFMGISTSAPPVPKQHVTSPTQNPAVPNVMISKNPSLRGREPVNRSANTTPVNTTTTSNGHSALGSSTRQHNDDHNRLASLRREPPLDNLRNSFDGTQQDPTQTRQPSAGAVRSPQMPATKPPAPPQPRTVVQQLVRAFTPPEPSISPPPPPVSKAAAPTTTNEAGLSKTLPMPRQGGKVIEIHEMPGSRPDGYESEEEIVMSATAFPGQEWMPVFERWED